MFENQRSSILIDKRHLFAQKECLALRIPKSFKCALLALSVGTAGVVSAQSGNQANQQPATLQQFNNASGEYQKREYLTTLMSISVSSVQSASSTMISATLADNNLSSILSAALMDESPIVVEQALNVIGIQHQTHFVNQVVFAYANADVRFGGYSERVKIAAISTLGAIGGSAASPLFATILSKENTSTIAEHTLMAIQAAGDKLLAKDVESFGVKMNSIVDKGMRKNDNPILYSQAQRISQLANTVLSNLSK